MLNIIYKEIDSKIQEKIVEQFGEWVIKYNCLHFGVGCYSIAAIHDNQPIGFISTYKSNYPEPLSEHIDAFIDVIEVAPTYRRYGIASKLIRLTEKWAKNQGFHQIRSWSSDNKHDALQMWYALNYCVSPALMRGKSVIKEYENKPIQGFYLTKLLSSLEEYPHIIREIYKEVEKVLPHVSLHNIKLIRAKDGVYVYRGKMNNQGVVIKYFEKEEYKREISNYRILRELSIPTMEVLLYGESCIVLEDIDCSPIWRLGIEEDLEDKDVALQLAHWYFDFHEKGVKHKGLDSMYRESDRITIENLDILGDKLPEAKETIDYIIANLDKLQQLIIEQTQTLNYNDFYWTNLLVSKDKSAAMPFDYNFLGAGFRYNDMRNATSSLSTEAGMVFLNEYNRLFEETYGFSRKEEERKEQEIDSIISVLFTVMMAYDHEVFPNWATEEKDEIISGGLLKVAKHLLQ